MSDALHGAAESTVRRAIETRDPLPGTRGFAGRLDDGRLVRDVLGRYPLFVEADRSEWAFEPTALADPSPAPAGVVQRDGERERIWELPDPNPFETDDAALAAVRDAVGASLEGVEPGPAIAFSGGVDSAVLAANLDASLYAVGFPDSHDLAAARESARLLDRGLEAIELDHDDVERGARAVARATGRTNPMDVSIALPLYLVAERAASDGHERLAVGQGADELFGGYEKVARHDHRVEADTVRGAARETIRGLPDQLERDVLAIRAAGIEPIAPILDDRVVSAALGLDARHLVRDGTRKWAFREAAREWLPERIATREKKAVQYGSLVSRELDRLARRAGFKRRMDDHVERYVESLLDD